MRCICGICKDELDYEKKGNRILIHPCSHCMGDLKYAHISCGHERGYVDGRYDMHRMRQVVARLRPNDS